MTGRLTAGMLAGLWIAGPVHGAALVAESVRDAAATRGAFLSLAPGARPAGMGGAFTAVADDASAGAWNPAGLANLDSGSLLFMHQVSPFGAGISHVAGAVPAGPGVAGGSLALLAADPVDGRDEAGNPLPATGLIELAATGAWGMALGRFGLPGYGGGSVEFHRNLSGSVAFGLGLGGLLEVAPGVNAGLAVSHLGLAVDGFSLPATLRAGAAYAPVERWRVAADLSVPFVSKVPRLSVGGEYWFDSRFAARAGIRRALADQGLGGSEGISAGLGARLGAFGLDYAVESAGEPGWAHRISILWRPAPVGRAGSLASLGADQPAPAPLEFGPPAPEPVRQAATMPARVTATPAVVTPAAVVSATVSPVPATPMLAAPAEATPNMEGPADAPAGPAVAPVIAATPVPAATAPLPAPVVAATPPPVPVPVAALYAAAKIKYGAKDYRGAWKDAADIIRQEPRDARAWQLLGNCQYQLGDTPGALKSFGYSLQFNPDNPALKSWVDSLNAPK